jgi:hypothetical protein
LFSGNNLSNISLRRLQIRLTLQGLETFANYSNQITLDGLDLSRLEIFGVEGQDACGQNWTITRPFRVPFIRQATARNVQQM